MKQQVLKILPSIISFSSVVFGFIAIQNAIFGHFSHGLSMFLLCIIADILDGYFARKYNVTSVFGGQVDSLCDSFSFGIAPAICIYFWFLPNRPLLALLVCTIVIIALMFRLARFNAMSIDNITEYKGVDLTKNFIGLPAPLYLIFLLLPVAILQIISKKFCNLQLFDSEYCLYNFDNIISKKLFIYSICIYYIFVAYLAVSSIPISSMKSSLKKSNFKAFMKIIFLVSIAIFCPEFVIIFVSIFTFIKIILMLIKRRQ